MASRPIALIAVALLFTTACTTRNPLHAGDTGPDIPDGEPAPDHVDIPDRPVPDLPWPPDRPDWGVPDLLPFPDLKPPAPDTLPPPPPPTKGCLAVAGLPCKVDGHCFGNTCVFTDPNSNVGVCGCACTPDNLSTPLVNEDSCPDVASLACATVRNGDRKGGTVNVCMRKCKPALHVANPCPKGTACDPRTNRFSVSRVDQAFCGVPACLSDNDCPEQTGQQCLVGAGGSNGCQVGSSCLPFVVGGKQGRCVKPGRCDKTSGLCLPRLSSGTQQVGSPCKADQDCPANGHCELPVDNAVLRKPFGALCVDDSQCCSGRCDGGRCTLGLCEEHSRNGYCVIDGCLFLPEFKCSGASTCVATYAGGRCLATCNPSQANSCRGLGSVAGGDKYGDYECRDWSQLSLNGVPVANAPVCQWGDAVQCNGQHILWPYNNTALTCAIFGAQCRALDGSLVTSATQVGLCLDATASAAP
ncbi:MAG: hypothetical protein KC503_12050 [Myxococcales bacterium]|nr:hypothetical protein [Myxococcales bacterium]